MTYDVQLELLHHHNMLHPDEMESVRESDANVFFCTELVSLRSVKVV